MCVHILNLTSMAKAARHSLLLLFVGIWQDRQVLLATTDQDQPQSKTSHGTDQDEVRDRLQGGRVLAVIDEATRTTANSRGEKGGGGGEMLGQQPPGVGRRGGSQLFRQVIVSQPAFLILLLLARTAHNAPGWQGLQIQVPLIIVCIPSIVFSKPALSLQIHWSNK